jgi:nicotinamide-nucleotide amidase
MQVEIITIGDELLIGQTINTNAAWLGDEFSKRGFSVNKNISVKDSETEIYSAFENSISRADITIVTGGLGPTKDDITKKVICNFFKDELIIHEETLENVKSFFKKINRPMLEVNIKQAEVPKTSIVLPNKLGTAPGLWMQQNKKILISLPGVPYEMKNIMTDEVFPRLLESNKNLNFYSKTGNIQGIGEAFIADKMYKWEEEIRSKGLELAYLPSVGIVKLRITSKNGKSDEKLIDYYFSELQKSYPYNFYGFEDVELQEIIGVLLKNNKKTLSTAESCTGGALGASIVSVAGSSEYFKGGFITYSNESKKNILKIKKNILKKYGAVSKKVVKKMTINGNKKFKTDYCIAVSGIAGPTTDNTEKPIGTVWIAIAYSNKVYAKKFLFGGDREKNIRQTVLTALNMLRVKIEKNTKKTLV